MTDPKKGDRKVLILDCNTDPLSAVLYGCFLKSRKKVTLEKQTCLVLGCGFFFWFMQVIVTLRSMTFICDNLKSGNKENIQKNVLYLAASTYLAVNGTDEGGKKACMESCKKGALKISQYSNV